LKRANGLGSEDEEQTIIREYLIKEMDFTSKNVVEISSDSDSEESHPDGIKEIVFENLINEKDYALRATNGFTLGTEEIHPDGLLVHLDGYQDMFLFEKKSTDGTLLYCCCVGSCPGFSINAGLTRCKLCERPVHSHKDCSGIHYQDLRHERLGEFEEGRYCIECVGQTSRGW
jgi:hypothetical protein